MPLSRGNIFAVILLGLGASLFLAGLIIASYSIKITADILLNLFGKMILQPALMALLARHVWPGNVRELENVIGHACMMAMSDTIDIRDLPEYLWDPADRSASAAGQTLAPAPASPGSLEEQERRLILEALEAAGGNQSQAARILHVGRDALRYKLKKYNLAAQ